MHGIVGISCLHIVPIPLFIIFIIIVFAYRRNFNFT